MFEQIKDVFHSPSKPRRKYQRAQDAVREEERRRKREEEMLRSREEYALVSANSMGLKQQPHSNGSANNKDVETNHPVGNPGAAADRKQRKHRRSNSSSMPTQPPLLPPIDTRLRENSQVKGQSQYKSRLDPGSSMSPQKSSERTEPAISALTPPQGNHDTGTFYKNDDRDETQQSQVCQVIPLMGLNILMFRYLDVKQSESETRRLFLGDMQAAYGKVDASEVKCTIDILLVIRKEHLKTLTIIYRMIINVN